MLFSILFSFLFGFVIVQVIISLGNNPAGDDEISIEDSTEPEPDSPTEVAFLVDIDTDPDQMPSCTFSPLPKAVSVNVASTPVPEPPVASSDSQPQSAPEGDPAGNTSILPATAAAIPMQSHDSPELKGSRQPKESKVEIAGSIFMEFVFIPPGEFMMGSPENEIDRFADEGPQHAVKFSTGFWLGKYEVTQEQWAAVMRYNPSKFKRSRHPVENVSWDDCQNFINEINHSQNTRYRLPTEAEWEYACRAGSARRFYWGEDLENADIEKYAWFNGNSGNQTHEVGLRIPNHFGLYDLSGNVWEWCSELKEGYSIDGKTNPTPSSGALWRVCRGGGWISSPANCRSAARFGVAQNTKISDLGFRLAINNL